MINRTYFKRLQYTKQDIPSKPFSNLKVSGLTENIEYRPIADFLSCPEKGGFDRIFDYTKNKREKNCGLGDNYIEEVKEKRNAGVYIKIDKAENEKNVPSLFIRFNLDTANNTLYDQSFIHAAEGAKVKIFLYYDMAPNSCGETDIFRSGLLTLVAEKNSMVEFIKVQNLSHCGINFETMKIHALENAQIKLYDIQLGAKINGCSNSTYMPEEWADVQIFPLYFADKDRRIDLEQNFIINGKNSQGLISARGALKNKANKVFRGNIFLNKGCSHSIAKFADNTIMLDKTTVGASIPTIFCDEDDVIGEHAASFEAVNKDKLYYLMTRGFDELSAKKLIIEAAFKPVFEMIDDEQIKEKLIQEFNTSLDEISE